MQARRAVEGENARLKAHLGEMRDKTRSCIALSQEYSDELTHTKHAHQVAAAAAMAAEVRATDTWARVCIPARPPHWGGGGGCVLALPLCFLHPNPNPELTQVRATDAAIKAERYHRDNARLLRVLQCAGGATVYETLREELRVRGRAFLCSAM